MAALSLGTAFVPFPSCYKYSGVVRRTVSGAGSDDSTVVAAVSDKRHVIVGGWVGWDGDSYLDIYSGAGGDLLVRMHPGTDGGLLSFPRGCESGTNAALVLNKSEAAIVIAGYIDYVTVADGDSVPLLENQ